MIKITTIITAITLTLATTTAQASPISDFCYDIADLTEIVAEARDRGISRTKAKTIVAQAGYGDLLELALELVDVAYDNPWETPSELMADTYQTCMVTLSTPV